MKTKDSEHLQWLHNRMIHVYGERPNVDFLNRFRTIIEEVKEKEDNFESYLKYLESREGVKKKGSTKKRKLVIPKTTREERVRLDEGYDKNY
tara:strand:+ start:4565 stop:4840 length:276 start_codon:yes stop_codon:yes gene_type:complete